MKSGGMGGIINSITPERLIFFFLVVLIIKKPIRMVRFNDLRSLNVKTGLSYQYMFTGVMTEKDNKSQSWK